MLSIQHSCSAMVLFGMPPEDYWPYDIAKFDNEPPAFCYAFAQNFQTISYYCLNPPNTLKDALLNRIKIMLAAGLPSMFGFTVYSSISQAAPPARFPTQPRGSRFWAGTPSMQWAMMTI